MRGSVIILTGAPGAGKSTTARSRAVRYERAVHLHTDDFWHWIVAGAIPPYLPESEAQNQTVMQVIAGAARAYAEGGYTVVVDGIVGPWMLHHFRAGRSETTVPVHYLVLRPDRQETVGRAAGRAGPDALTDAHVVRALWDQFADLGDLEGHAVDTSDQAPADTLEAVTGAVASGSFLL